MIVQTIWLYQVHDIELVGLVPSCVGDSKVEPLAELRGRAMVELQVKIVFEIADLSRSVQVSAFESRFKDKGRII